MYKPFRIFLIALIFVSFTSKAQTSTAAPGKPHRWTVYGGFGPNYYINNLELGKNLVNEVNYAFVTRIMWEPEYRLSLGLETGYNRLYSMTGYNPTLGNIKIVNVAIPIQLVISMKFFENFYGNFSMGQTILINDVTTETDSDFDATTVSLGDFGLTAGYRKSISDRIFLCAEIKGYYSSKLDDKNISLVFLAGYKFFTKKYAK